MRNTDWLAFFLLTSLEALAATLYLLTIPGDPKNSVLFGYSLSRLLMASGLLLAFLGALGLALRVRFRGWSPDHLLESVVHEKKSWRFLAALAFGFLVIFGCFALLPDYRVSRWGAVLERLRPLLLWLALVSGQLAVLFWKKYDGFHSRALRGYFSQNRGALRVMAVFLILFMAIGIFIAATRVGIQPDTMHWNESGVPLLSEQVLLALLVALSGWGIEKLTPRWRAKRRADTALFLLLWLIAAVLWVAEPQPPTFFAPGPYPPNEELYPFSDAASYDLSAQYALLGQGLGNRTRVDKPLLSAFLVGLHLLAGQNQTLLVNAQAALLAVLPALLYLLVRRLLNRTAGLMAASLMIFHGVNTITASRYIQTSSPKLIMSEFPLAALLALFVLWLVRWLTRSGKDWVSPLAVGGILSLATLVRHNVWLLVAATPLIVLPVFWRRWRAWLLSTALMMGMLFLTVLPWMWRTSQVIGTPFYFLGPLRGVVWTNRYLPSLATPTPLPVGRTATIAPAAPDSGLENAPTDTAEPALIPQSGMIPQGGMNIMGKLANATTFVSAHFFHNLAASVFILPLTPVFEDLAHIVRGVFPFWQLPWDGTMPPLAVIGLIFNLFVLALGLSVAWRLWRYTGWIPMIVYVLYLAACAVARTSGGRYIVPVSWIVLVYYAMGWVEILGWLRILLGVEDEGCKSRQIVPNSNKTDWLRLAFVAFTFLLAGSFPLVVDVAFPRIYPEQSEIELLQELDRAGVLNRSGLIFEELAQFSSSEDAWVVRGRALYPRFYLQDQGEAENYTRIRPYPRLTFSLIGAQSNRGVILPSETIPELPNGADVVVIGCKGKYALDGWAILWLEKKTLYRRSPDAPLGCPLPEPICDENHHCR